jgi:O-antigen/teichoic acid export membrane protein
MLASSVGLIVVAGVTLVGGYGVQAATLIALVATSKLIEGISDIFRGRLQQLERMDWVSIALVIQGLAGLAFMFVAGILGGGPETVVAALPVAMAMTLLLWDLPCYARHARDSDGDDCPITGLWRQPLRWSTLGRLSVVSFPIAVAGFLLALLPQLPKYVIDSILGEEAVAVYALITYWITLGMMVVTAMGNAIAPRLAQYHAAGEPRAFARLLARIVLLVAAMGAAGVALVGLFGPKLAARLGQDTPDLPRLAFALSMFAAMLYLSGPLGRALGAMRRFWTQTILLGMGIAVALGVLPWAVGARGLTGAAEAMALSVGLIALLAAGILWRELHNRIHREGPVLTEAVR